MAVVDCGNGCGRVFFDQATRVNDAVFSLFLASLAAVLSGVDGRGYGSGRGCCGDNEESEAITDVASPTLITGD